MPQELEATVECQPTKGNGDLSPQRGRAYLLSSYLNSGAPASGLDHRMFTGCTYAGIVTSPAHLRALTTYASIHRVPILVIVGKNPSSAAGTMACLEWPLRHDLHEPDACFSAD